MKLEIVEIPGRERTLAGLRYVPEGTPQETALIFSHGFTSGKYSLDHLAGYLAGHGYEGLTFDFVGHKLGGTGGEMRSAAQVVENLSDVLRWFGARVGERRIVLIGHSMGAAATLAVAAQTPRHPALAGLVCLCIGRQPSQGFSGMVGKAMLAQRQDYVAGAPALQLLTELDTLVERAAAVGNLPALFVAARQDVLISVERVEALAALIPNASVTTLDTSHLEAPDRARGTILHWLEATARRR